MTSFCNTPTLSIVHPAGLRHALGAAAMAALTVLTACGGGGHDPQLGAEAPATEVATVAPEREQALAANVSMTKVHFTNSSGQALTGFLFQSSTAQSRNAAVVMMHGCSGVWSNGVQSTAAQPGINTLSHIHRRWGAELASRGYAALLVDSFSSRSLPSQCNNGAAGLNEAVERPKDALAGRAWLLANSFAPADRVALLGWSNGGSAVMATMEQSNAGGVGQRPFAEGFAFYPGCGLLNEFGGNASALDKTTWLPYAPVRIFHGSIDPLYAQSPACENRVTKAHSLGASVASANAVEMTVFAGARHSFDQIDITKPLLEPNTQADVIAQTSADAAVVQRLAARFAAN